MSLNPGLIEHFIPSDEDPNWDANESEEEFYQRCLDEMSINSSFIGNATNMTDTNRTSFDPMDPSKACETILMFKNHGLYGPGYKSYRQLFIIIAYSLLIIVGTITNLSVCWVVVRNTQARTARNLFIINLAVSDISVCLITMPLTMLRLIHTPSWNYGANLCKMIGLLEGTNLLVSSGTASAIAGDRLCLVTRKTARHNDTKFSTIVLILILIWTLSFLTFLPTFFFNGTFNFYLPKTGLVMYHVCAEFWPSPMLRFLFTAGLMFVQYVIPITVILVTHMKIINIVKLRMSRVNNMRKANSFMCHTQANHNNGNSLQAMNVTSTTNGGCQTQTPTMRRNKKTTQILLIIAFCFGISWLPYHCFMMALEVNKMSRIFDLSSQAENDIFTLVHMLAMSSTITNPILYGWLNTNLKHLFRAMIPYVRQERSVGGVTAADGNASGNHDNAANSDDDMRNEGDDYNHDDDDPDENCLNRKNVQYNEETVVTNASSRKSSPESEDNKNEEADDNEEEGEPRPKEEIQIPSCQMNDDYESAEIGKVFAEQETNMKEMDKVLRIKNEFVLSVNMRHDEEEENLPEGAEIEMEKIPFLGKEQYS